MFVPGKDFLPSLMFFSKARSLSKCGTSTGWAPAFLLNIKQSLERFSRDKRSSLLSLMGNYDPKSGKTLAPYAVYKHNIFFNILQKFMSTMFTDNCKPHSYTMISLMEWDFLKFTSISISLGLLNFLLL